jgi:rhodanese-related sulfurtransferase
LDGGAVDVLELQQFGCPVVEVREPEEFAGGHVPGAVNYQTTEAFSYREQPIVLCCLSGGRSALAADKLASLLTRSASRLPG